MNRGVTLLRLVTWLYTCISFHSLSWKKTQSEIQKFAFKFKVSVASFFPWTLWTSKNENKKNPTKPKINPTNVQASGRSGWLFSSSLNQRRRYIIVFTQHEELRGRGEKRKKKREREKGKKINLQVNYRRRAIRAHPSPVCPKTTSSVLSVHFSSGKMSTVGPVRQVLMASWPYEVFIV